MNRYTYALNNPIRYYDPSGCLAVCQYGSFAWEFGKEAVKITLNNTIRSLPRRISEAKEFIAGMNEFIKGKYSAKQIRDVLGQSFWDGLSGNLRFVFSHLDWYKTSKKLTTAQVKELAQRSARAYEEGIQIIITVVMTAKAVKGKIKVAKEQKKQMKMDLQYFAEKDGLNTGKWNEGSFGNAKESLKAHFNKHGKEVGAKTPEQYLRKAEEFVKTAKKNSTKSKVSGTVEGVTRYKKNGKYIDLAPDDTIISFGKQ